MKLTTSSPEATEALGRTLAGIVESGLWILLEGELGAGKTVLVRGMARGLDWESYVTSPTYCLVQTYEGRLPLHHVDLYRLESEAEIAELGLDELAAGGVLAVEWAQKLGSLAPAEALKIALDYGDRDEIRHLTISGPTALVKRLQPLMEALRAGDTDHN